MEFPLFLYSIYAHCSGGSDPSAGHGDPLPWLDYECSKAPEDSQIHSSPMVICQRDRDSGVCNALSLRNEELSMLIGLN